MNLNGARVLVTGTTGVLGGALTAELAGRRARTTLAGRDPARPTEAVRAYPGAPTVLFDAYDPASCARTVRGAAAGVGEKVAEYLMAVNVLAPAAFFRAALGIMRPGSVIAAVTGVVAERPRAGMADYSTSEAALSTWLGATRHEVRTVRIRVLDLPPGHLATGFADRPVAGTAPPMPAGGDPHQLVGAAADAMEADAELVHTTPDGMPVVEKRAR
ncbi:SDR family NAD(P)-dependent oxidoreductase [Streptomyces sp. NPDC004980]